ncbi:MAG: TIGR03936 family radical SAM-associated protein [Phototrophicales bacterium]|nr:TIGR03936 family radical SAM-associated protein [Phototrophicales bacterium]
MSHLSPVQQRLHITFGKYGALQYIGSLDMAKIWERVLRRADLPIYYSQGFSSRPRIQVAARLPLGVTSDCELLDLSLREKLSTLDDLPDQIMRVSPDGLRVLGVIEVPQNMPAPQTLIHSAHYRISIADFTANDLQMRIDDILRREQIVVEQERNGRRSITDFRPMIYDLHVGDDSNLYAHLATGERGNFRPHDLLDHMGFVDHVVKIHRTKLFLEGYEKYIKF